jgi:hypothetical protein
MAKPCVVTYKGKEHPYKEWINLLHEGELDRLIESKVITLNEKGATKSTATGRQVTPTPTVEQAVAVDGSTVKLPPSMKGGMERTMVFKDGNWQQEVGGSLNRVGDKVQAQADEAFKASKKAEPKTMPAPAKTKSEQIAEGLLNALGIENIGKFKNAAQKVQEALEATGISVEVVENKQDFQDKLDSEGVNRESSAGATGVFISKSGKIFIDASKINAEWGNVDVWHEGTHPIINIIRNTNPKLYNSIVDGLNKLVSSNPDIAAVVEWAKSNYEGENTLEDETIVETIARIANGNIDLSKIPTSLRDKIIDFINEIAKSLGLNPILKNSSIATFKKMAGDISAALKEGKDISSIVGKDNVQKFEGLTIAPNNGAFRVDSTKKSNRKPNKNVKLNRPFDNSLIQFTDIDVYEGKVAVAFFGDMQVTADVKSPTDVKLNGRGGGLYPVWVNQKGLKQLIENKAKVIKDGSIWATTDEIGGNKLLNALKRGSLAALATQKPSGVLGNKMMLEHYANLLNKSIDSYKKIINSSSSTLAEKGEAESKIKELIKAVNSPLDSAFKTGMSFRDKIVEVFTAKAKSKKSTETQKENANKSLEILNKGGFESVEELYDVMYDLTYEVRTGFFVKVFNLTNSNKFNIPSIEGGKSYKYDKTILEYANDPIFKNSDYGDIVGFVEYDPKTLRLERTTIEDEFHHKSYHYTIKGDILGIKYLNNPIDGRAVFYESKPKTEGEKVNQTPFGLREKAQASKGIMGSMPSNTINAENIKRRQKSYEGGIIPQFSKGREQNSQIKDYIESQRAAGESDADIRAGIESVADRIGLTEQDINDLMSTTSKAEDTAATQPTEEKPNFKLEGEGREKERSFTNKQFLADKSIPDNVKAAVTEDAIFYNELPNSVSVEVANKIYDLLGSQEALDAILDEGNGMSPVVRIVLGQVIIRRAKLQGGSKAEADIMLKAEALLAKKGTEYGQAIQAFSLFQFLSKEGQIMYAVKQRQQEIDAKLKKEKSSVDARKKALNKINEKTIDEVLDGKVGDVVDETTKIKPTAQSKNYGEKNKIVTKKRYEEIKKALRGKFFSSIPPELVELGVYHIEAGSRKFAEFSKAMIGDVGTGVKKYLRDLYDRSKSDYESNGGDVSGFSNEDEITDAENQDQAEKLAKFIVNRAKQKKQSNDPVKQMVSSLLAKVGEKLPKRELDKMTDIDKIALAIKNREQYADVWEKSKTEVEALIDKLKVSEQEKDRMRRELQSYYDEIIGQPFAETTLNKAVREGLNQLSIDVKDVIRKHYTVADNAKRTLVEKLVMDANLSDADARYLAAKVEREFNRIATEKKKEALDKLKKFKEKIPTKKRQVNQLEDEIIALSNLGAFSDEDFLKIYAEKMGWQQISEADIRTIGRLAEIVEREQDGFRRARAVEDLLAFQARLKGTSLSDVSLSIWYANVLSGHDTQLVNFSANNGNLLINYAIALMRNPKDYKNLSKSILLGFRRGMLEAQSTLRTGYSPVRGRVEIPNTLELVDFTGILKPANMAKYVRRIMAAADVLTFEPAKEMRAYQMARKIAHNEGAIDPTLNQRQRAMDIMGNTREKVDAAKIQAQEEYNKRVKAINDNTDLTAAEKKKEIATERRDMKRRVFELIEQQRAKTSADIIPKSEDYARRLTYNYKPEGVLGTIANLVNQGTSMIPALKLVIPFTNIVANVANESLNYSPLGFVRAATSQGSIGASLFKKVKGNETFDADQKAEMIIKASIGLVSTIALLALTGGDPEDEDTIQITADGFGNYKDNYTLTNRGWQPYSIRVNGKWYSYKYWAVMPMFALIGKVRDSQHYKKEKFDDTYLTKFKSAAGSTVKTFFDNTFLSSINGFFNTIFNESTDNTIDDAMRGLMKTLNSFVLPNEVSQAAKEVESKMGIAVKDMDDRYYLQILKDVPFARNIFQNKVNALGDDIIPDTDKFISEVKIVDPKVASVNDLWAILVKNKYPLRTMSYNEFNNDGIYDPNEDKQRVITPEEYYGFMKVKGGTIKEFMFNNYEDLQELTPKEFSFIMGKVKEKSNEIAKLSIFTDYYEDDINKIVKDLEEIDIPKEVEEKNKKEEKEE